VKNIFCAIAAYSYAGERSNPKDNPFQDDVIQDRITTDVISQQTQK
jgi:hypothetical protein